MGSPPSEAGRDDDERQHRVCVEDFAIGKYEVTVGQFRRFADAIGYRTDAERDAGGHEGCRALVPEDGWEWRDWASWRKPNRDQGNEPDHPVACISWNDALAYIEWLNRETGGRYRLPTEAEWEYAARAGTGTARFWGDDPDDACTYANVADRTKLPNGKVWSNRHDCTDGHAFATAVGSYRSNPWGLYDMLGNVWEWTFSAYDGDYGGREQGAMSKNHAGRVADRGGSWNNWPRWVRSAIRLWLTAALRDTFLGFRLAQD